MFKYLSLFLISCMIGITWSGMALAQWDDEKAKCCTQNEIDNCNSDSSDNPCCSGECASDGSDATKSEKCCQEAGGDFITGDDHRFFACCKGSKVIKSDDAMGGGAGNPPEYFCCQVAGTKQGKNATYKNGVCCAKWAVGTPQQCPKK